MLKQTQREHLIKMKVKIGVIFLHAEEFKHLRAHHQKLREQHGIASSSESLKRNSPANSLISDFNLPELRDNAFLISKPLSLQYFVWQIQRISTPLQGEHQRERWACCLLTKGTQLRSNHLRLVLYFSISFLPHRYFSLFRTRFSEELSLCVSIASCWLLQLEHSDMSPITSQEVPSLKS